MLKVLLVEDSAVLAERISEILTQIEGVEVVGTASDEATAVAFVKSARVDVLVLDLQLKHGTGFGVLRHLGVKRPVVVVMTNYALPEYRRRAKEMGVDYFLNKSLDYDQLPIVVKALQRAQLD